MRKICVILACFVSVALACTGDCRACHQNLDYQNDIRHNPMLGCKTCHTDAKMSQIDMGGCGEDCFACHNSQKVLSPALSREHIAINRCITCHKQMMSAPSLIDGIQKNMGDFKGFDGGVFGVK